MNENYSGKRLIEMVCTGNKGRSPMAELYGNLYLKDIEKDSEYHVISSGTMYDAIVNKTVPEGFKTKVVETAKKRGDIYPTDDLESLTLNDLYEKADKRFDQEERHDRAEYLKREGIEARFSDRQQTVARDDVIAVFPMAKSNKEQVEKLYVNSANQPLIAVLKAHVTGNEDDEVKNAYGQSQDVYNATIDEIKELVPKAIDRVIDEHERKQSLEGKLSESNTNASTASSEE